jgi:hypothetical protein
MKKTTMGGRRRPIGRRRRRWWKKERKTRNAIKLDGENWKRRRRGGGRTVLRDEWIGIEMGGRRLNLGFLVG